MQDIMRKFIAQPVIYPINKKSTVSVIGLKDKTIFKDDTEYKIYVVPMCYSRAFPKTFPI